MEDDLKNNIKEVLYNFLKKNNLTLLSLSYLKLFEKYEVLNSKKEEVKVFDKEDYLKFIKNITEEEHENIETVIYFQIYNENKNQFINITEEEISCFRNLNLIKPDEFNAFYLKQEVIEKQLKRKKNG